MLDLPSRLKTLRNKKSLTQKAVAEFLKIYETSYQKYELGKRIPTCEIAIKLADCFGVSIDYLLGQTDNPERNL